MKNKYLAFVLDDESRTNLIRLFKPSFSKVICHHVTIEFNLDKYKEDYFSHLLNHLLTGTPVKVNAIGAARGDGVECVAVSIDGERTRADGSFYHVTLCVEPPHKPVESNKLQDKVELIRGFVPLTGSFQLLQK